MVELVFRLPDVGEGTAEAEIVAWHVKPGDSVAEDQRLVDVMTDKAIVEMTSPVSGVVSAVHGQVSEKLAVGSPLVVFAIEEAETVDAPSAPAASPRMDKDETAVRAAAPRAAVATMAESLTHAVLESERPKQSPKNLLASPAVRRRAFEQGIALQFVRGTGPVGRITQEDLDAYIAGEVGAPPPSPPPQAGEGKNRSDAVGPGVEGKNGRDTDGPGMEGKNRSDAVGPGVEGMSKSAALGSAVEDKRKSAALGAGVEEIKIVGLRRKIAERMQEAKWRIPHITYVEEIDLTELEDLRLHLNETKRAEQPKLTLLPFFVRALVCALPEHPSINARFDDDAGVLHQFEAVHCGIATQTPNGLLVPVLRNAGALDLWSCATEIARLAAVTRAGKATREELSGSTITVTSLGALGGVSATHVINRPEVAIIGPNRSMERPVVRHGVVTVRRMMNLSSSFDHRIVDGHEAAEFVQRMKALLERPATLFIAAP